MPLDNLPPRGLLSSSAPTLPPWHPAWSKSCRDTRTAAVGRHRAGAVFPLIGIQESYPTGSQRMSHKGTGLWSGSQHTKEDHHSHVYLLHLACHAYHHQRSANGGDIFPIPGRWCMVSNQKFKSFLNFPKSKDQTEIWLLECWKKMTIYILLGAG